MFDLMEFPDISASDPKEQAQMTKEFLFRFVQKYNLMVQEVNKQLSEIKEKVDNGNI